MSGIDFNKIKELTDSRPKDRIKLDNEQELAVYCNDSNILVIAAAGSGKTRVLTERIRRLVLDEKVTPESIVAITFTNMAADEMKERLNDIPNIHKAFIGTIHSYANSILRSTGRSYRLQTDEVVVEYIRDMCRDKDFFSFYSKEEIYYNNFSVKEWISYQKSNEDTNNKLLSCIDQVSKYDSFRNYCKSRGIISFEELIVLSTNVEGASNCISHLLVDEFQDISPSEYSFLSSLPAMNRFYVGDDWQSIYSFKGSNVGIFNRLANDSHFTSIYLVTNYRCNHDIVEKAESELEGTNVLPKKVKCVRKGNNSVKYMQLYQLLEYVKSIDNYSNYFILSRRNDTVKFLSDRLSKANIPNIVLSNKELDLASRRSLLETNKIKIMTIHSSKGLETDNVIVIYDTNSNKSNLRQYDEEQRVKYVAYTRAKNLLIIVNN